MKTKMDHGIQLIPGLAPYVRRFSKGRRRRRRHGVLGHLTGTLGRVRRSARLAKRSHAVSKLANIGKFFGIPGSDTLHDTAKKYGFGRKKCKH